MLTKIIHCLYTSAIIVFIMIKIILLLIKLRPAVLDQCCLKQSPPTPSSLVQCHPSHPITKSSIMPTQGKLCTVLCPLSTHGELYSRYILAISTMLRLSKMPIFIPIPHLNIFIKDRLVEILEVLLRTVYSAQLNFSSNAFWYIVGVFGFQKGT